MPYRALQLVMRGVLAPVQPGEEIPDTYQDAAGVDHPVDFERLIELGVAEKITATEARKSK